MTKQEENVTVIQLNHSDMFKDLVVRILQERLAIVQYDSKLEGRARDVQNFELNEQRLGIRTRLRSFYPADHYIVTRFSVDLSNDVRPAVLFSTRLRNDVSSPELHHRVELLPELWEPQNWQAAVVHNAMG